jgi:nicotinamide mononucleotide transporter
MNWLEGLAVATGFIYVILAIREDRWCWVAGFLSTLCYVVVCGFAGLWLQMGLQCFYVLLCVAGWRAWRETPQAPEISSPSTPELNISHWSLRAQLLALAGTALFTLAGYFALTHVGSEQPLLEAATTAGGLMATWMTARKVLENWPWWVVIDTATAVLYWRAEMPWTAWLYVAYAALAIVGWRQWHTAMAAATKTATATGI